MIFNFYKCQVTTQISLLYHTNTHTHISFVNMLLWHEVKWSDVTWHGIWWQRRYLSTTSAVSWCFPQPVHCKRSCHLSHSAISCRSVSLHPIRSLSDFHFFYKTLSSYHRPTPWISSFIRVSDYPSCLKTILCVLDLRLRNYSVARDALDLLVNLGEKMPII